MKNDKERLKEQKVGRVERLRLELQAAQAELDAHDAEPFKATCFECKCCEPIDVENYQYAVIHVIGITLPGAEHHEFPRDRPASLYVCLKCCKKNKLADRLLDIKKTLGF